MFEKAGARPNAFRTAAIEGPCPNGDAGLLIYAMELPCVGAEKYMIVEDLGTT